MVGTSDYGPVTVPNGTIELRVHGVSGTPPEALLKDTAVLVAGTPKAGFHRHQPTATPMTAASPGIREAYAWGGLTSGSRLISSLRLLLLPFSLVNVAGWMLPGVTDPLDGAPTRPADSETASTRAAAHALVSRLLAVCLTAYVTLGATWVATVVISPLAARYHIGFLTNTGVQARVTFLAVLALIGIWVAVAHRRAKVAPLVDGASVTSRLVARAPAAAPAHHNISVATLWGGSEITRRLSGIHSAIAVACAALLTEAALGSKADLAKAGQGLAAAAIVLALLGLVALVGTHRWARAVTGLARGAVPLALVASALALSPRGPGLSQDEMLKRVGTALTIGMASLAVAVFILVFLQFVVGPRGGPGVGRLYAGAFTVIGFGTAITAISGLAVIGTWWLTGGGSAAFVAGLAQTIAIIGLVAFSAAAVVVLLRLNPVSEPASVAWFTRMRDTVAHARGAIVVGACVFAIGANVVAGMYLVRRDVIDPAGLADGEQGWASWGWFAVGAVVAALFAARLRTSAARVAATVVGAVVVPVGVVLAVALTFAWVTHRSFESALSRVVSESDEWFVIIAVLAALVAPMAGVIAYMWRGSKDQDTRRIVGVLWDIVNFWPRQFHPWAPPPYTDTTIPELAERVQALSRDSGAHTIVVSAHSQGAIIAVPALSKLHAATAADADTENPSARVCLLTYGQLLDAHYRWLFPWVFNPALFAEVDAYVGGRWINLYRVTDPLGQPVRAVAAADETRDIEISENLLLDLGSTSAHKTLNHGDYWYSHTVFQGALDTLSQP